MADTIRPSQRDHLQQLTRYYLHKAAREKVRLEEQEWYVDLVEKLATKLKQCHEGSLQPLHIAELKSLESQIRTALMKHGINDPERFVPHKAETLETMLKYHCHRGDVCHQPHCAPCKRILADRAAALG